MNDPLILFQRIVRDIFNCILCEYIAYTKVSHMKYSQFYTCSDNNSELAYVYKHFWFTTSHADILNPHPTFFS